MKHLPALVCVFSLVGCLATSADIQRIADAQAAFEAGLITSEEFQVAVRDTASDVQQRGVDLIGAIKADPVETLLSLAGVVGASILGTNRLRNVARRKRGEPV